MSSKNYGSLNSNEKTTETTRLLADSLRISHNNEEIGSNVLLTMKQQREQMDEISDNVTAVQSLSRYAHKALRDIQDKSVRRKLWLYLWMILLLAANIYVGYRLYHNEGSLYAKN